jgi:uncharacterized protein DUF6690
MLGMFGKPAWLMGFLAAAFVIPYALCDKQFNETLSQAFGRGTQDGAAAKNPTAAPGTADEGSSSPAVGAPAAGHAPLCDMESVFRFDLTSQWVTATWPRVTTVAGDASHSGMRVPLVTGVMPDDLVGTLTYYFDDRQRVQRITFGGNTGDPRRLVALVTSQYDLKPQPTLDAGLYQTKWNGQTISTLHVRHASVVAAAARHGKFDVELDLKRADPLAGTVRRPARLPGW